MCIGAWRSASRSKLTPPNQVQLRIRRHNYRLKGGGFRARFSDPQAVKPRGFVSKSDAP